MLFVILAVGAFAFTENSNSDNPSSSPIASNMASSSPRNSIEDIPSNWQTYTSREHGFSIMYPPEITIEQRQADRVRFIQFGPSQEEGTELYDGISLTINSGSLDGASLSDYVQQQHSQTAVEPTTDSIGDIEDVQIANYSGYEYEVTSLGTFTHMYLLNDSTEYLHIVNSTVDPNNSGFSEITSLMLSTLNMETPSTSPTTDTVNVYFVALEDGGRQGTEIGCGDSLIALQRNIASTDNQLEATMNELLSNGQRTVGETGLYNALYQSDLEVESADVENGVATVNLQGEFSIGGACDTPRVEEQLTQTASQFPNVTSVRILINGQELSELLSAR